MPTRRTFLQSLTAAAVVGASRQLRANPSRPTGGDWPFALQTGTLEPLCGPDVVRQIELASAAGFTAFSDPDWIRRSVEEQTAIHRASRAWGIALGPCRSLVDTDEWLAPSAKDVVRLRLLREANRANRHGIGGGIRCEVGPIGPLRDTMRLPAVRRMLAARCRSLAEQLAAETPASHFSVLIEPWDDGRVGLEWYRDCAEIVALADHPRCRLAVDVYRLAVAEEDVPAWIHCHHALIGHVELADYPGGGAPGTGRLDIDAILAALRDGPANGQIALRHALPACNPTAVAALAQQVADKRHESRVKSQSVFATSIGS